jgi:hypothetical protein
MEPNTAVFDEVHLDAGMAAPILRQEAGEEILDHLRRCADPKDPGLSSLERPRALAERVRFSQQAAAAAQQIFAFRCQLHAATDPVEQRHAELGFERLYLPRQRRLAQVQAGSRAGDAAGVDNGRERAQVLKVHAQLITYLHHF